MWPPVDWKARPRVKVIGVKAVDRIPAEFYHFKLEGNLVHFAAFQKHIGFFPPVRHDEQLKKAVSAYAGPKGNLRFPLDEPIPYPLIRRIVKLRIKENLERAKAKREK